MRRYQYTSNLAFIDLLFNLILGFVFLFTVSFLLINDPTEDLEAPQKAEYMAILQWDGDRDIDIDLWMQGPEGLVGFREPSHGFVYLDKDDLGHRNDVIRKGKRNEEILEINREVINIRGFQPGEYIINAHYFFGKEIGTRATTTVTLELVKLNPYEEIWAGSKEFKHRGQEETFVRFHMKENGRYYNINELPKNLVMSSMEYLSGPYSGDGTGPSPSPYSTSILSANEREERDRNRRYGGGGGGVSAPISPPANVDPEQGTSYQYNNWNTSGGN